MFYYMSIKNLKSEINSYGMDIQISSLLLCGIAALFADGIFVLSIT